MNDKAIQNATQNAITIGQTDRLDHSASGIARPSDDDMLLVELEERLEFTAPGSNNGRCRNVIAA